MRQRELEVREHKFSILHFRITSRSWHFHNLWARLSVFTKHLMFRKNASCFALDNKYKV